MNYMIKTCGQLHEESVGISVGIGISGELPSQERSCCITGTIRENWDD